MNVARHRHTAHQLGPARVVYRFHPLFGSEVQVVRRLRAREEPTVIVQGPQDLRVAIPCWMLDEECCRIVVVEEQPRLAVEALMAVRALVEAQALIAGGKDAGCDSMMVNEERHESPAKDRTPSADRAPSQT